MTRCVWTMGLVVALLAAGAWSQPLAPGDRLSLRFDFEQDVDADGFPDGWRSVDGRHPQNIRERLDAAERRSGKTSLLVEPDGLTNVYETTEAYRFDPRFSYRLSGWIRTHELPASGLRATVARVEVAGLDADGRTSVFTAATPGVTGTADWTEVTLDLPRDLTRAFRRVRLRLVTDGPALSGKAWFDDVAFEPQSALRVAAGQPNGFLSPDQPHAATVALDTLIDRDYRLTARLFSPEGTLLLARPFAVEPQADFVAEAKVELPLRAFGVHRLEFELTSAGKPVASSSRTLLYSPGAGAGPKRLDGIGIAVGALARMTPERVAMFARAPFGTVTTDLFDATDPAGAARLFAQLRQCPAGGIEPVAVLGRVPDAIVRRLFKDRLIADASEATWPRVLALEPAYGTEELLAAVKPVAERTLYYQLGLAPVANLSAEQLRRAVRRLRETLAPITWDRRIVLVVDGTESDDALASGADVLLLAGSAWECGAVDARLRRLRTKVSEVWMEAPVPAGTDARKRADKLIERIIRAKAAGADRVILTPLDGGLLDAQGAPTEMFAAAATAAREIGGKQFARKLATKTPAWLFSSEGASRLAVIPAQTGALDGLPLGSNPLRISPEGNVTAVIPGGRAGSILDLGRPFFLDGVE